jgi:hypothetical protein
MPGVNSEYLASVDWDNATQRKANELFVGSGERCQSCFWGL